MKVFRLILTFYFIALLVMPCSDINAQSLSNHSAKTTLQAEDKHSEESGDTCSPLCFCSCCQITVIAFKVEPLFDIPLKISFYFSKKILFHKNNIAYQVYDHIWQPPKI